MTKTRHKLIRMVTSVAIGLHGCPGFVLRLGFHTMSTADTDSQWRSTGGGIAAQPAFAMLAVFASVGVQRCDLTLTDVAGGKIAFRSNRTLDELRSSLSPLL